MPRIHCSDQIETTPEAVLDLCPGAGRRARRAAREKLLAGLRDNAAGGAQWICWADSETGVLARVVARRAPELRDDEGMPLGLLGCFAAENREDAVTPLLREAVRVLKDAGCGRVLGPLNGDTWHRYRFNLGPADRPPFFLEPENPPYYPALWTAAGFEKNRDYFSQHLADITPLVPRSRKFHDRARARGFRFRSLDRARFSAELDLLYDLSCAVFPGNYLYTPTSRGAFHALYEPVRAVIVPELVWFAFDAEDRPAGFLFMIPDLHRAVEALKRGMRPFHYLLFRHHRRKNRGVNLKTIGVLPEHRGSALAVALLHRAYGAAVERGYRSAWHCLIMEGNTSASLDFGQGVRAREYRLYQFAEPRSPSGTP